MLFKTRYKIAILEVTIICECLCSLPRISMPLGTVLGSYKTSAGGRIYESYENIPYASPPKGKRRFEPPQPIQSWPKEINGTLPGSPCMQYNSVADVVFGDEDCLYLNIYKPISQQMQPLLPVIIEIHGGGFQFGSGTELGPKYIMDKDVIFITFNYRLGPLGFLSTGDNVISGNMGLKDQSLALLWVHENSKFFGGDAKRISLVGVSSGAASVHYHYLSTMSKGLFQNGISLSGTALAPWGFSRHSLKVLQTLLDNINCPNRNSKTIAECVKKVPAYELYNATRNILKKFKIPFFLYLPVAEKVQDNFFVDRDPQELLRSGHVHDAPWITGVVSEEGLHSFAGLLVHNELTVNFNIHWNEMMPYMLYTNEFISHNISADTGNSIKTYYFQNNSFEGNVKDVKTLAHLVGDSTFLVTGERAARFQALSNKSPVWFYYYNYRGDQSISDILTNTTKNFGVCHGDDAFSVFENDRYNPRSTVQDKAMSMKLLNFWYSIASQNTSEMLDNWPKVDPRLEEFSYFVIGGPNELHVESSKNFGNKLFWTSI